MSGSSGRLDIALCRTSAELAAALAAHWDAGHHSLTSGNVAAWLERHGGHPEHLQFVRELARMHSVPAEARLLRLIQQLAPTHPPVWRGASLLEPGLCEQAGRAERCDRQAQQWLVSVFVQHALHALPPAQYPSEAALAERWETQYDDCMALWHDVTQARTNLRKDQTSVAGVSDFDALVYGEPAGLRKPEPAKLLPIVLLSLTDPTYQERLRERTREAAKGWLAHNRWLERLLNGADPTGWIIAGFLLPYARDAAAEIQRKSHATRAMPQTRHTDLCQQANEALVVLRTACTGLSPLATAAERHAAATAGKALMQLLAEARSRGVPAEDPLMRCLRIAEPKVRRIVHRLETWAEVQRGNPLRRMLGIVELRNAIRELGRTLPTRVPSS